MSSHLKIDFKACQIFLRKFQNLSGPQFIVIKPELNSDDSKICRRPTSSLSIVRHSGTIPTLILGALQKCCFQNVLLQIQNSSELQFINVVFRNNSLTNPYLTELQFVNIASQIFQDISKNYLCHTSTILLWNYSKTISKLVFALIHQCHSEFIIRHFQIIPRKKFKITA